jgi:O-antigen/teichoic acid export membrane protein
MPIIEVFKDRLRAITNDRLYTGGLITTISHVASGLLGYLYQILMARVLQPAEFATFSALMASLVIFSSPLSSVLMLISRVVSQCVSRSDIAFQEELFRASYTKIFIFGSLFLLFIISFSSQLASFFFLENTFTLVVTSFVVVFTAMHTVNVAYLQAYQYFSFIGVVGVIQAIVKICASFALVMLGLGILGAVGGVFISISVVWVITYFICKNRIKRLEIEFNPSIKWSPVERTIPNKIPVFLANFCFVAMTQIDLVVVNYLFESEIAALYATGSVLGKAVLYLPGGIVFALFPMVASADSASKTFGLFIKAMALTVCGCGFLSFLYFSYSNEIIALFFGPEYSGAAPILRWFGFAILPMALVLVAEYYLIALGKVIFAWFFIAIAPLQVIVMISFCEDLMQILAAIGGFGLILWLCGFATLWVFFRKDLDGSMLRSGGG